MTRPTTYEELSDEARDWLDTLERIKALSWDPEVRDGQARMVEVVREMNAEMADMLAAYFAPHLH